MSSPASEMLVKPAQFIADKGIAASSSAAALCTHLEGRSLLVRVINAPVQMCFAVTDGRLIVSDVASDEPDTTITTSAINLMRLSVGDAEQLIREGGATVAGNEDVAADFQELFRLLRPDPEEELAKLTGDVFAHEAGRAVRGVAGWLERAGKSLGRSAAEFVTEETRDVAGEIELQEFCSDVDKLSLDVDRAAARLSALKRELDDKRVTE